MNKDIETIKALVNALNTAGDKSTQEFFQALAQRLDSKSLEQLLFILSVEQQERDYRNSFMGDYNE